MISGITPSQRMMDELLNARPGSHSRSGSAATDDGSSGDRGINFPMFLTMMSERLFEFDTEAELIEAFESFDENDTGMVKVDEMRKWLSEVGERMDIHEVKLFDYFTIRAFSEWISRSTNSSRDHSRTDKGTSTTGTGSRFFASTTRRRRSRRRLCDK